MNLKVLLAGMCLLLAIYKLSSASEAQVSPATQPRHAAAPAALVRPSGLHTHHPDEHKMKE